jgi:hypothetical protein
MCPGYRTLIVAYRELSTEEVTNIRSRLQVRHPTELFAIDRKLSLFGRSVSFSLCPTDYVRSLPARRWATASCCFLKSTTT